MNFFIIAPVCIALAIAPGLTSAGPVAKPGAGDKSASSKTQDPHDVKPEGSPTQAGQVGTKWQAHMAFICTMPGEKPDQYIVRLNNTLHQPTDWEPVSMAQFPFANGVCTSVMLRRIVKP